MFPPSCCSTEAFQLCVIPSLKFREKVPWSVTGVMNCASAGGSYVAEANGGNGLLPPVATNPAQGLSNEIGFPGVAFNVNVGSNGGTSPNGLYCEYCMGAVNMPNPARMAVFGILRGCHTIPTLGSTTA